VIEPSDAGLFDHVIGMDLAEHDPKPVRIPELTHEPQPVDPPDTAHRTATGRSRRRV
jgi:hypothetical protein